LRRDAWPPPRVVVARRAGCSPRAGGQGASGDEERRSPRRRAQGRRSLQGGAQAECPEGRRRVCARKACAREAHARGGEEGEAARAGRAALL